MEPLISMGVLALIGAAATIAGASEDLESDVGSQSNANSQVQLAPQMGYIHRIYNKAIAGEPVSNGMMCTIGATGALVLIKHFGFSPLFALVIGALIAAMVHGSYSVTAIMGREASQARFKQPIYLDLIRSHTPTIMAFAFLTTFSTEVVSYLAGAPTSVGGDWATTVIECATGCLLPMLRKPMVMRASTSSWTCMVPISAAKADAERPATRMAVMMGPSSRTMATATSEAT